jgi:hypothetical protein
MLHLPLSRFVEIVKYDPANPPASDYEAQGMKEAHERTQSDFKGQKQKNTANFAEYLFEGLKGSRKLNLPVVYGWQSTAAFGDTDGRSQSLD